MLYSEVRPGDIRRLDNDSTTTESFEIHGSIVPLQSQKSTLTLTAALAFTNVSEKDVFGPFYMDHIRTIRLTTDYRLQDNFGGTNYLTATWRQGLEVFGASRWRRRLCVPRRRIQQVLGAESRVRIVTRRCPMHGR